MTMEMTFASTLDLGAESAEGALLRCVDRLEALIEDETMALRAGGQIDFDAFNLRKTHAMLEFARIARKTRGLSTELVEQRLERLRERLAVNARVLDLHLRAMTEITNLVVESIREDESYGAYSRGHGASR